MRAASFATVAALLDACALGCSSGRCDRHDAGAVSDGSSAVDGMGVADAHDGRANGEGGANASDASGDASGAALVNVRFANWSPDAPGVDFCLAPHGTTTFMGPLVAAIGASEDAGVAGLAFPRVSAYAPVAPGVYDVRIVVSSAMSCVAPIASDKTMVPALLAGDYATIALMGEEQPVDRDPVLEVVSFVDDHASSGGVAARFINAAPALGGQVDMEIGRAHV